MASARQSRDLKLSGHKARAVFDRYNIVNEARSQDGIGEVGRVASDEGTRAQHGHNLRHNYGEKGFLRR